MLFFILLLVNVVFIFFAFFMLILSRVLLNTESLSNKVGGVYNRFLSEFSLDFKYIISFRRL